MFNHITRNFSSAWSMLSAPFRAIWRGIVHLFPEREITMMDTPSGNVYSYHQTSFLRFTKFCMTFAFSIWAIWSTYIYVYHRPLLQKRTQQLAEVREVHARQMNDLSEYMKRFSELTRSLNVIDDKVLNSDRLSKSEKESLIKQRLNIWGELDFLQTRITNTFTQDDYTPEFRKMSELSVEYDVIRERNNSLQDENNKLTNAMLDISYADSQIVGAVSKLTQQNTDDLMKKMRQINGTLSSIGLSEDVLAQNASRFESPLVGRSFNPLNFNGEVDSKYQDLADKIQKWAGIAKLNQILPFGKPVRNQTITSTYGFRKDPFNGGRKMHKGIDFSGKIGSELYAIAPGRVVSAGERIGYGKTVEIDHGLGFTTLYAHLSKINVKRGDWVRPGNIVGLAGSSGRSTGPHLHYEIRYKGTPFDPINFVKEK